MIVGVTPRAGSLPVVAVRPGVNLVLSLFYHGRFNLIPCCSGGSILPFLREFGHLESSVLVLSLAVSASVICSPFGNSLEL